MSTFLTTTTTTNTFPGDRNKRRMNGEKGGKRGGRTVPYGGNKEKQGMRHKGDFLTRGSGELAFLFVMSTTTPGTDPTYNLYGGAGYGTKP